MQNEITISKIKTYRISKFNVPVMKFFFKFNCFRVTVKNKFMMYSRYTQTTVLIRQNFDNISSQIFFAVAVGLTIVFAYEHVLFLYL